MEKQTKDGVCNPGDYEDLGKGVKGTLHKPRSIIFLKVLSTPPTEHVMPHTFDGCKIIINKGLSRHFQTAHTLTLGATTQPTQWQFGATYVGTQQIGENEASFRGRRLMAWEYKCFIGGRRGGAHIYVHK